MPATGAGECIFLQNLRTNAGGTVSVFGVIAGRLRPSVSNPYSSTNRENNGAIGTNRADSLIRLR